MNTILYNFNPSHIKSLYNSMSFSKAKDKLDMILEPLQAMIQIALLGMCPIGTKLTIQENILYLQHPTVIQPISRWYNADKKDDLLFLFQVIRRFIKWYNPSNNGNSSPISLELYQLIIRMSIRGLESLLKTYNTTDVTTVIQIVGMYKNILQTTDDIDVDKIFSEKGIYMDEVFQNIVSIYDPTIINLISNSLVLIERETDEGEIANFIQGLNLLMSKINKQIQNWIKVKMIF
jgi:hypothetical protein